MLEFQVDGNTLLPTIEVERAVMSHLGESQTIQDIEAVPTVAALEAAHAG